MPRATCGDGRSADGRRQLIEQRPGGWTPTSAKTMVVVRPPGARRGRQCGDGVRRACRETRSNSRSAPPAPRRLAPTGRRSCGSPSTPGAGAAGAAWAPLRRARGRSCRRPRSELTPATRGPHPPATTVRRARPRQARAGQREVGIERGEVHLAGDLAVLQHEHGLDQPGDAGGGLEMPEIGLGRAQIAGRSRRARGAPTVAASASTSIGSPSGVAGAVRLHVTDSRGRQLAVASASRTSACWARPFGAARTVEWPSWLTAEPRMTRQDAVAVGDGIGQPLEHDDAAALAAHEAVGARRRTSGSGPSGDMKPTLRQGDHEIGREHQRHAAGERDVAVARRAGSGRRGGRRRARTNRPCRPRGSGPRRSRR